MVFSSVSFLFYFLPVILILYFLAGFLPLKARNAVLLTGSLVFYGYGGGIYILVMLFSIAVNYIFGILLDKYRTMKSGKVLLASSVAANLLLLFYFKYFNFLIRILNSVLMTISGLSLPYRDMLLPIGISFFTFQGMSYVIDVYRGDVSAAKNPLKVALYISLFPQLIAGPIVRYSDIDAAMSDRNSDYNNVYEGSCRFITGLCKKVIIADILAATADPIFNLAPGQCSRVMAWMGIICYTFQIYFDFSGYSDMAIGLGRIFGFTFPENFIKPYQASSVREFWRRWHITLSSFFRDYVYIPLGGNRTGNVYFNLLVVFFLTGLWHGAAFNFVFWGLWHGAFLVLERILAGKIPLKGKIAYFAGRIYTMAVVMTGLVFFRCQGLINSVGFLKIMAGFPGDEFRWMELPAFMDSRTLLVIILAALISFGFFDLIAGIIKKAVPVLYTAGSGVVKPVFLLVILALSMILIINNNYSPFIYFRF